MHHCIIHTIAGLCHQLRPDRAAGIRDAVQVSRQGWSLNEGMGRLGAAFKMLWWARSLVFCVTHKSGLARRDHPPLPSITTTPLSFCDRFATASRKSLFGSVVLRFPPRFQPLVYMSMHVALGAATLLFTALWWKYKIACEIFLVAQFGASAWSGEWRMPRACQGLFVCLAWEVSRVKHLQNTLSRPANPTPSPSTTPATGATFYFDVFSRRYIAGLSANSAKNSAVDLRRQGSVDSAE